MESEAKGHIVIIEDDQPFREVLKDYLEAENYRVTLFESALTALDDIKNGTIYSEIRSFKFPVIVSDNLMPQMDGLSLLNQVHSLFPQVPFVLMTAFGSQDTKVTALQRGAFAFIQKPFHLSEFEMTVANAIAKN